MEIQCTNDEVLDALEGSFLMSENLIEFEVKHSFTPGMYIREIFMPKGSLLTSKIHNTEHPFVVLSGSARVYLDGIGVETLRGGHSGVTKAGTRRALYIEEDCRWVTFHPLDDCEKLARDLGFADEELISLIEHRIIDEREIPESGGLTANGIYKELLAEGGQSCLG